jgi:hypothetical protein
MILGFHKIYIVLRYGRVSDKEREYLDFVRELFGIDALQSCTLVLTYAPSSVLAWTKQEYVQANKEDGELMAFVEQCGNVLFVDNKWPQSPNSAVVFAKRRREFYQSLLADMQSSSTLIKPLPMTLAMLVNMLLKRFAKGYKATKQALLALVDSIAQDMGRPPAAYVLMLQPIDTATNRRMNSPKKRERKR